MRQHLSAFLFVASSVLMGVANCAADSTKPSSEPTPASPIAQLEEGKDQPPSGEIQERAVPLPRPGPSGPPQFAPPPLYVGPTQNITKVANALQVKAKSLTIQVTVAPGLALTQPVTISIAFIGQGGNRLTQTYVASTGNTFMYNDPEGNGQPRPAHLDITLTEPKPSGGLYTYTVPGNLTLDPLYAVRIDPLQFRLVKECACPLSVHTDIYFYWLVPDQKDFTRQLHFYLGGPEVAGSTAGPGKMTNTIFEFAWINSEVSGSANFHMPDIAWQVPDCSPKGVPPFGLLGGPPFGNLVLEDTSELPRLLPGQTHTVTGSLEGVGGPGTYHGCYADFQYTITYTLRTYPAL